jgi:predicted extracellular nuclease
MDCLSEFIIQLSNLFIKGQEMNIRKLFSIPMILLLASCNLAGNKAFLESGKIEIHDIQGCGHISPYNGKTVNNIAGIVTWKVSNGFFMQDQTPDDRDCTSEAIFVFTDSYPEVIPGDGVRVDGKVSEFVPGDGSDGNLSVTEIESQDVKLVSENNDLPETIVIGPEGRNPPGNVIEDDKMAEFDPQKDGLDFYESLEGMRVQINSSVVIQARDSYNEIFVIPAGMADANILSKDGALIQTALDANPERLLIVLPDNYKKKVQVGDRITDPIIGVLNYEYGNYRLIETNLIQIDQKDRTTQSSLKSTKEGVLRIATYNVNNYNRFDQAKVKTLAIQIENALGLPDILVMQEVEDDSALDDDGVTTAEKNLKALIGVIFDNSGVLYHYVDPAVENNSSGGVQGGNIRTVILFRNDRGLEFVDTLKDQYFGNNGAFSNSRTPTTVKFTFDGNPFYVIGVHLVSNNLNSPLFGATQPIEKPEEDKRVEQAEWIANMVEKITRTDPGSSVIVLGDFNDTPWSETLQVLKASGMYNTSEKTEEKESFSFIFEGNASLFDQILVTPDLIDAILTVTPVHLNTWKQESDQASDHDPILVEIKM